MANEEFKEMQTDMSGTEKEDEENFELDKQEVENLFGKLSDEGKKYCMNLFAEIQYVLMSTEISQEQWESDAPILARIVSIIEWRKSKDKYMMASNLSTSYDIEKVIKYVEDEPDPDNVSDRESENKEAGVPIHRPKNRKKKIGNKAVYL